MIAKREYAAKYDKRVKPEGIKMSKVSVYLPERIVAAAKKASGKRTTQEALRAMFRSGLRSMGEEMKGEKNRQIVLCVQDRDLQSLREILPDGYPAGRAIGELIKMALYGQAVS